MCKAGGPRCNGSRKAAAQVSGGTTVAEPAPTPEKKSSPAKNNALLTGAEADRRRVDKDGFVVVGTDRVPGTFGGRPSLGGLGSVIQQDDRIGLVTGLEATPGGGLQLDVVWLNDGNTSQAARNRAMRAYQAGERTATSVPAEGLIALDAYLPDGK